MLYNPDLPVKITTDALSYGIGAVLSHVMVGRDMPVAFASKVLKQAGRNYSQLDS